MALLYRILSRFLLLFIWLGLMSVLGFGIAVANNSLIKFNLINYWRFLESSFTSGYFFFHKMHSVAIIKLVITTLELVIVATLLSIFISYVLVTFTIHKPKLQKYLYRFFNFFRLIPFIMLPLLFNQVSGQNFGAGLQNIDENNFNLIHSSRLFLIVLGNSENLLKDLTNFLGVAFTTSYFILPTVYILFARVTQQVTNYQYVKTLNHNWSAFQIMHRIIMHRLIPVLLKELPPIIGGFVMFVGVLEYLFNWRGIGGTLIRLLGFKEKYSIEIGLIIFIFGTLFVLVYFGLVFLKNLYDVNKRKELPYEIE